MNIAFMDSDSWVCVNCCFINRSRHQLFTDNRGKSLILDRSYYIKRSFNEKKYKNKIFLTEVGIYA